MVVEQKVKVQATEKGLVGARGAAHKSLARRRAPGRRENGSGGTDDGQKGVDPESGRAKEGRPSSDSYVETPRYQDAPPFYF